MERKYLPLALTLSLSLSISACGAKEPLPAAEPKAAVDVGPAPGNAAPAERTLYDRLGGKEGIDAIGNAFLKNLQADPRVSDFFRNSKGLSKFKQQLCQLSGGPCQYTGKDMRAAHSGMGLSDTQFDAFIEDFRLALDEKGVSQQDKSALLATLAPMRTDVVEKKGKN